MKILHLLSQRPELTGSGMYVQAVVRQAALRGHENVLVAGIPDGPAPALEVIDGSKCAFVRFGGGGLPFPVVGMSDVMPYRSTRFSDLTPEDVEAYEDAFASVLTRVVTDFSPDIIHSHHLWQVSALARKLFPGIPMVTSCHGTDLRQFETCPRLAERVLGPCGGIDEVMALTRTQAEKIASLYHMPKECIHVVGGGYDESRFAPAEKPSPPPVEILYAGKLSLAKGVPWLLKSLTRLTDLPWRLHLAGSSNGAEKDLCHALAETLGDRVVFHGMLSQNELADLMKQSHLFVLPSFFEGLPLVLLEALACGCRLVATSLPGVREVLGDTGGEFIRLVDLPPLETVDAPSAADEPQLEALLSETLREQILTAMKTPEIDMASAKQILAPYTWSGVFARIERVYEKQVIGHRGIGKKNMPPAARG
ncbi:glycoside hydrolase [Desulfoluna limicola]|uniref:Glycoside hydrolase n=1 Tax=Desulfoluna limicola TaxID=2810562 RepID=A0ABN6FAK3_9BACT|nr:glycosyltransferase family 4 protein [Desulfoluna limicola]BCS98940.1 glycoside hydrolase [Desulfoluna limicola]